VKYTMNVNEPKDEPKEVAGRPTDSTPGERTANINKGVRPQSAFTRCGNISLEKMAVKVTYESFGKTHTAFISASGVRSLVEKGIPADVSEVHENPDGAVVIAKVGTAKRSQSGRALVMDTTQSAGQLMTPWVQFRRVVSRVVMKAAVSRLHQEPRPEPRRSIAPANSIYAGLARGF